MSLQDDMQERTDEICYLLAAMFGKVPANSVSIAFIQQQVSLEFQDRTNNTTARWSWDEYHYLNVEVEHHDA